MYSSETYLQLSGDTTRQGGTNTDTHICNQHLSVSSNQSTSHDFGVIEHAIVHGVIEHGGVHDVTQYR